jgi:uncharacterized membrane protein
MNSNDQVEANVGIKDFLEGKIIRGTQSWEYIYVALGFAIAIEGTVVQMITPLVFPWNILVYAVLAFITFRLFISSDRFQNKLLSIKRAYEDKPR